MDKAEYKEKLEEIKKLAGAGNYEEAAKAADVIDWRHVRSIRTLCMVSEIYEAVGRYEASELLLKNAYKRTQTSKAVIYRLTEINIRLGDFDEARRYLLEFEQIAPRDNLKFILKYRLLKAQNVPLDYQIEVLKEYKDREYNERGAFELARLYYKNGQTRKCIEECDDMILWFAEGKYVERARKLKRKLAPISPVQQINYDLFDTEAEQGKLDYDGILKTWEVPSQDTDVGFAAAEPAALADLPDPVSPIFPEEKEEKEGKTAEGSEEQLPFKNDLVPEDGTAAAGIAPEEEERDNRHLLGIEDDESLGLTRELNIQDLIHEALKGGESVSEAARKEKIKAEEEAEKIRNLQSETPADIVTPEEAAEKTVSEASGFAADMPKPEPVSLKKQTEQNEESEKEEKTGTENEKPIRPLAPEASIMSELIDSSEPAGAQESDFSSINTEEEVYEDNASVINRITNPKESISKINVEIRSLTETEKKIFTYFADIPGVHEQVTLALADLHNNAGERTSRKGNIIIQGRPGSGKTHLADGLIKAACYDLGIKAVKRARIRAEELNRKDPIAVARKMGGGFLIIENAGKLSNVSIRKLTKAMEFRTDHLVVILEDAKEGLRIALDRHERFAEKFTSRIIVPVFTNDELVTFAKLYARENGYKIDEMGTLALYTHIGENQRDTEPVTVGMVRDMVDRAIEKANAKKFSRRFSKGVFGPDGRRTLLEKDFDFDN
ncbi:MAG: hypothetical protein K6E30_08765 [Lachnospiraceae bacterium]|nr:hypothetical protein [Lachnospiraceae bacterium]